MGLMATTTNDVACSFFLPRRLVPSTCKLVADAHGTHSHLLRKTRRDHRRCVLRTRPSLSSTSSFLFFRLLILASCEREIFFALSLFSRVFCHFAFRSFYCYTSFSLLQVYKIRCSCFTDSELRRAEEERERGSRRRSGPEAPEPASASHGIVGRSRFRRPRKTPAGRGRRLLLRFRTQRSGSPRLARASSRGGGPRGRASDSASRSPSLLLRCSSSSPRRRRLGYPATPRGAPCGRGQASRSVVRRRGRRPRRRGRRLRLRRRRAAPASRRAPPR